MKRLGVFLIVVAIVLLILTVIFAQKSYDKYTNYMNSDYYPKNAYVGGDAYNYIINGTYFTAFAIYASACGMSSIISFAFGGFLVSLDNKLEVASTSRKAIKKSIDAITFVEE